MIDKKLDGYNLEFNTLEQYLEKYPNIYFVFLRQLGCIFCRDLVGTLKSQVEMMPHFPKILFFHPGNIEQGIFYFSEKFPTSSAVADPKGEIYNAFSFHEGSWIELFHPMMFVKAIGAYKRGARQGSDVQGNYKFMGGVMFYQNKELKWEYRSRYAGDLPGVSKLIAIAQDNGLKLFD